MYRLKSRAFWTLGPVKVYVSLFPSRDKSNVILGPTWNKRETCTVHCQWFCQNWAYYIYKYNTWTYWNVWLHSGSDQPGTPHECMALLFSHSVTESSQILMPLSLPNDTIFCLYCEVFRSMPAFGILGFCHDLLLKWQQSNLARRLKAMYTFWFLEPFGCFNLTGLYTL